ncbi:MAG: hypothetical protein ACKOC5_14300 [Chloroflexota bacterium]
MYKMRIALIVALLFALLIPFAVQAAGVFYCNSGRTSGGNGTYADPWACSTTEQFNYIVYNVICPAGGGWLYEILAGGYNYYRIEWVNNQCQITYRQNYPGYPPNTGVELPMPLLVGGVAAVGAVLIIGGVALRRKNAAI